MKLFRTYVLCGTILGTAVSLLSFGLQTKQAHAQMATVPLQIPLLEARPVDAQVASQPILRVTLRSGQSIDLPMSADTWFWKDKPDSHGTEGSLTLRDNRFAQALLKPDLSKLPQNSVIESAQLRLFGTWRERAGNARINVFRMQSNWSEDATFQKPVSNQEAVWNGMKAGIDYDSASAATFEESDFTVGKVIVIDGLEGLVNGWLRGTYPNYGIALQLSGRVNQIGFGSREAKTKTAPALVLGGSSDSKVILRPDTQTLQAALLKPDDIRSAALRIYFAKAPTATNRNGVSLSLHRLLKADIAQSPVANKDYESQPFVSVPLTALDENNSLLIPNLQPVLQQEMKGQTYGFIANLQMATPAMARPEAVLYDNSAAPTRPLLEVAITKHPNALLFDHSIKPRAGVYNRMVNGHFNYGGQRLRLWGTLGVAPNADRLRKMGFNAWRLWRTPKLYTAESAKRGEVAPIDKDAPIDEYDKFFASLKQSGMFVMFAGLTSTMPLKDVAVDGSFVAPADNASQAEKEDWQAWKQVIKTGNEHSMGSMYIYLDPRLQKIRKTHVRNFLTHVNPITGKSYAEDEAIALYEVFNESGFIKRVMDRGLGGWDPYFLNQFQTRWNEWLKAKYVNDAALLAAWGKVDAAETLTGNGVKLGPISKDSRNYPQQRGDDFNRFVIELVNNYNLDFEKYCRSLAPTGVGINVVPFSFDTQYQPSTQWAYQRSLGQVNSIGMYSWDLKSTLSKPPGIYVMDSHDVEGKATVIYETNQGRPNASRAEYPFRVAALASWQDWDAVFWHYWSGKVPNDEDYLTMPMPHLTVAHYWNGVHHQNDPVMTTSMALAGRLFLNHDIEPAPNPVIVEVGGKSLFGFNRYNALGLTQTTFTQGSRLRFKPESNTEVTVNGGPPPENQRITAAVRSGDQILWDWPNERLIIDTPTAKVYVGKTAPSYRFKDGITLSGFDTPFISWAMISTDGKPLTGANATSKVYINGVADARNTDFDFDWSVAGGPVDQAKAIRNRGRAPVIVDKVSYTISFPTQVNSELTSYDFALRQAGLTNTKGQNVIRVRESKAWMNMLTINGRGATTQPVVDPSPGVPTATVGGATAATGTVNDALAAIYNPLPTLSWGDDYRVAHRKLREVPMRYVSINNEDTSDAPNKTITWVGAEVLFDTPADIEVIFNNQRMSKIIATFTSAPNFAQAVASYEQRFGPAVEKVLDKAQFETNVGRWLVKTPQGNLAITLTLSQGETKAIYEFKAN